MAQKLSIVGLDPSETDTALIHWVGELGELPFDLPGDVTLHRMRTTLKAYPVRGDRLLHYFNTFEALFAKCFVPGALNVVCVEGYSFAQKNTRAHSAGELGGIIRVQAIRAGYQVLLAPPSTVKVMSGAGGGAEKDMVVKEVYKKWHYDSPGNDAADAYVLMRIAYQWVSSLHEPAFLRTKETTKLLAALEVWNAPGAREK